jgi:hypothetical protein
MKEAVGFGAACPQVRRPIRITVSAPFLGAVSHLTYRGYVWKSQVSKPIHKKRSKHGFVLG